MIHVVRLPAIIGLSQGLLQEMPAINGVPDLSNILVIHFDIRALQIFSNCRVLVVAENRGVFVIRIEDLIEFGLYGISFFLVVRLVLPVDPALFRRGPEHQAQKRVVLFQFLLDARL